MKRRAPPARRAALVELVRQPAPIGYDATPRNREQRRRMARALRRQAVKAGEKG